MGLKVFFLILIITSASVLILTNIFEYQLLTRFRPRPRPLFLPAEKIPWKFEEATDGEENDNLMNETTCNIPRLDPFAGYALQLIAEDELEHKVPKCFDKTQVRFEVDDTTSSLVQVDSTSGFWANLACCYVGFVSSQVNSTGSMNVICLPIALNSDKTLIPVIYDYIDVQCRDKDSLKMVYQDQFLFLRVKSVKENFKCRSISKSELLNIIFIGLDGVSHVNFQRFMPKTRTYLLKTMHATEFWGRNVVSWGTQGNILPTLTGCVMDITTQNPESYTENCKLIWTHFAEIGYQTFRSEDDHEFSTYFYPTLRENGTGRPETDYDWLPYIYEMRRRNQLNGTMTDFGCFDHQWVQHLILDRLAAVARHHGPRKSDQPYFNFVWTATGTHDLIGYTRFMDQPFSELFKELHETDVLNNTVLIFMSDHGMNYGSYARTYEGSTEHHMPFLYTVFPQWFRKKYSTAMQNLRRNAHRLTTPFDLHETLLDLVSHSEKISEQAIEKQNEARSRGISLFRRIPFNRTCASANIPFHYCICHIKEPVINPQENTDVKQIAEYLLTYLNDELLNFAECAQLRLEEITLARYIKLNIVKGRIPKFYDVVIRTLPNQAFFETSAMINAEDHVLLNGKVIRVNAYGNQSSCLDKYDHNRVAWLRSVCYCVI